MESRAKVSAMMKGKDNNTAESRARGSRKRTGLKRTPETVARLKVARARERDARSAWSKALWEDPAYRAKMATAFRRNPSRLETKMAELLDAAGVDYVSQYPVPGTRYVADFYIPRTNTTVEVDGARWHMARSERDALRDERIRAQGFRVVRLLSPQVETGVELQLV